MTREDEGIPTDVRRRVLARDGSTCRVCGRFVSQPALHHTNFGGDARGMGGQKVHDPDYLITVGWLPGHDCHLGLLHAHKRRFQQLSWDVVHHPGVSILQLERWMHGSRTPSLDETAALFWVKVDRRGADECWEWQGSCRPSGHGQLSAKALRPTPIGAHVMSFFLEHGRWPSPSCLHHCDNASCVNPAHLYEGTQWQNMQDRKARKPRFGAMNPAAKHGGFVAEIRARADAGQSQAQICRDLHINSAVVSRIVRRINYPEPF